jgi:cytochrome P450
MTDFETIDYFTDQELIDNPFPYYEFLRSKGPVTRFPYRNAVAITGFDEALEIYRDSDVYSSINVTAGPLTPLGFEPEGSDISALIDKHRPEIPMADRMISKDPPEHSKYRQLISRLFTPSRLRDIDVHIEAVSKRLIEGFVADGKVEAIGTFGVPFSGMVIANLLSVPDEDLPWFESRFSGQLPTIDENEGSLHHDLFRAVAPKFAEYLEDRRVNPRGDVMTELAQANFTDGETPTIDDLSMLGAFLFTAGQDTTARLLGTSLQVLAERSDLQELLRADRSLIPDFIEESLRFDGPIKTSNRLVRKDTVLAGVPLRAGTTVSLLNGAINRDPRRFDNPQSFRLGRPKLREHVAFARGAHTCIGAPLARSEANIALNQILDRLGNIRISEEKHGPPGRRVFHHEPHYILRGVRELHLTFDPL